MLEKGNELFFKVGSLMLDKFKELNDPVEIGKCVRTIIWAGGAAYITKVICDNGGFNFKDTLLIGTSKK